MNNVLLRPLAMLCVVSLLATSCGAGTTPSGPASLPEQSFTQTEPWTPTLLEASFAETPPDLQMMAGLFSLGSFAGRDAYSQAYTKARAGMVEQVTKQVEKATEALVRADNAMGALRSASQWYVLLAASLYPEARGTLLTEGAGGVHRALVSWGKLGMLTTTAEARTSATDTDDQSMLLHLQYVQSMDQAETVTNELTRLYGVALTLGQLAEASGDAGHLRLRDTGEARLDAPSLEVANQLAIAHDALARAHLGLGLLAQADLAYARDVDAYLGREIPLLEAKISENRWSPHATATDKELVGLALTEAKERHTVLGAYLKDYDTSGLPALPAGTAAFFPTANAGFRDSMSWLGASLTSAAVGAKNLTTAGASLAWKGVKATAGVVKDVAITGAKVTGQVVGTVIEATDATVKSTVDTSLSLYYGESPKTIAAQIKSHYGEAWNRVKNGKAGAGVYKDAKSYMEGAENAASDFTQKVVEKTIGKGIISTTTGFIAKTTVGFFTGVAKDSYDVLNPDASEEDTLMGMFGLVMTAVGGSGTAAKPTTVIKNGASTTKNLLVSSKNYLSSLSPSSLQGAFKDYFADGVTKKLSGLFTKSSLKTATGTLENVAKTGLTKTKGALDDVYNTLHGKVTKDIPDAWKGLFEKKSFGSVLDNVFGTTGDTPREWLTGYLENIVISAADDQVKNGVKSAIQYFGGAPEEGIPTLPLSLPLQDRQKAAIEALIALQEQESPLISTLSPALQEEVKKVLEERRKALTLPPVAKYAGSYSKSFPFRFSVSGLQSTGTIDLQVTADQQGVLSCSFNATQRVSGSYQGIAVNSSGRGSSGSCSGRVTDTGSFELGGGASGFATSTVMGQSYSGGSSVGFSVRGTLEVGGGMAGTFTAGGYSFPF